MLQPQAGDHIRFAKRQWGVKLQHPNMPRQKIVAVPAKHYRKAKAEFINRCEEDILINITDTFLIVAKTFEPMGWKIIARRIYDRLEIGFYMRTVDAQPEQYLEVVRA